MKGGDCKVPIQEDHRSFLEKGNRVIPGGKKVGIIAAFLLLVAMILMIIFTFQALHGICELRQEIELLKGSIKDLQKKIDEGKDDQEKGKDVTGLPIVGKIHSNFDLENYEDYTVDGDYSYEDYAYEYDDTSNRTEPETGENYTKDAKTATAPPRIKRNIVGYTQDGTSINSDTFDEKRNGTFRKNYHYSTPPSPSSYAYYYPQTKANQDPTTPAPRQIHSRRLRVHPEGNHQTVKATPVLKSGDSHNFEGNPDVEFAVVADDHLGPGRTRHRQRRLELDERHIRTGRMRPLPSAHFSGDTSKYVLGQHENFKGNGHLRHPQRTFVDWTESSWFHPLGMDRHFSLSDGILTIKESGLYFIYAQIYYYDEHDINGFRVYRNENETLLQCTTTTHSVERVMKGNTCFTAAAEYLNENDRISLGDLSESRLSLFEPGKSFFGVIKLGDVKIK
ncbi:protein eiger [Zophobas morio]|uniref:protein eiger n=1 Tax=Zophobas morio TaxID=2755281 RepID=UPI003082F44B